MNSQINTKQTKGRQNKKTVESAEHIYAVERNQNIDNGVPAISFQVVLRAKTFYKPSEEKEDYLACMLRKAGQTLLRL